MTMITPSYLGETIEYSSLHACRSTLEDPTDRIVFWGAALVASGITASLLFLPTLIAVVVAEAFSVRSLLIYAIGGAALFLLAYQGLSFGRSGEESIDHSPPPFSREAEIAAAAGVVFGLSYWALAGRKAGRWRERRDTGA